MNKRPPITAATSICLFTALLLFTVMGLLPSGCARDPEYKSVDFSNRIDIAQPAVDLKEKKILRVAVGAMISPKETFIYYQELLDFATELKVTKKLGKCFIFSTSAVQGKAKVYRDHTALRDTVLSKGYDVIGEYSCKGFNTNSFMKYLGGMNKGCPNENDIENARQFAEGLNLK